MEITKTDFDEMNFKYQFKINGEITASANAEQEINANTMKQSKEQNEAVKSQQKEELKKLVERFLTEQAKEMGMQELQYFESYWAEKYGLQTAYTMYEDQFKKLGKQGIFLKPKNILKAV